MDSNNKVMVCLYKGLYLSMESISFTQFGINSIYVGDVKGVYDPMFDVFYLYFADINFGIRIFSLDSTTLLSYSGGVSSPEPISEIIISGTNIYTTTYSTTINCYFSRNFKNLNLFGIISPLNSGYFPYYGTFDISSSYSGKYIAHVIYNSTFVYLQVVETTAQNLSSILREEFMGFYPIENVSVQFLNETVIALLINQNIEFFEISEGTLIIGNFLENCITNTYSAEILANNPYNQRSFNIQFFLQGPYNSGDLGYSFPLWGWFVVLGVIVLFIPAAIFMHKFCVGFCKNTKNVDELFKYDFNRFGTDA